MAQIGEVVDEPVARERRPGALDGGVEAAARVLSRLPPSEGVGAQRGDQELVVVLHHGGVSVERKPAAARQRPGRGHQRAQIPDGKDCRDGEQIGLDVDRAVFGIQSQCPPSG